MGGGGGITEENWIDGEKSLSGKLKLNWGVSKLNWNGGQI